MAGRQRFGRALAFTALALTVHTTMAACGGSGATDDFSSRSSGTDESSTPPEAAEADSLSSDRATASTLPATPSMDEALGACTSAEMADETGFDLDACLDAAVEDNADEMAASSAGAVDQAAANGDCNDVFVEGRPVNDFIPPSDGDTWVPCVVDGEPVTVAVGYYPCDDGTALFTTIGTYSGSGQSGGTWHVDAPIDLTDCDPAGDNEGA